MYIKTYENFFTDLFKKKKKVPKDPIGVVLPNTDNKYSYYSVRTDKPYYNASIRKFMVNNYEIEEYDKIRPPHDGCVYFYTDDFVKWNYAAYLSQVLNFKYMGLISVTQEDLDDYEFETNVDKYNL